MQIQATGARGASGFVPASGGLGDGVSASVLGMKEGESLYVCVDVGGGAGAANLGGRGGGASGVSRVAGFLSAPVLVAGGGGGGAGGFNGSFGGAAGHPNGSPGPGECGGGGGGGTQTSGGAGGTGSCGGEPGTKGSGPTASGPGGGGGGGEGLGGGGGGGGGYYGAGGGEGGHGEPAGGGGGGSDFCNETTSVSLCTFMSGAGTGTEAGEAQGDAKVTLTYTVVTTATCGKTTLGKSSDTLVSNEKRVNACALPVNGTMSELSVYLAPTSVSGKQLIKGIVYSSSAGKPATRLGVTNALTFKSSYPPGWYHLPFATPLKLSAGSYWIGIITGEASRVAGERYDSVPGAEDYNANTYTSGPSKTFGPFSTTDEQMSLYATYLPE
ncbi:MAG TPA: hypothetical protein VGX51_13450 [Solirubrobacteraceae bacterium]|nr:hypothetical protein [Solirubrobacteraceae bacterium]